MWTEGAIVAVIILAVALFFAWQKRPRFITAECGHQLRLGDYILSARGEIRQRFAAKWMRLTHCPQCLEKLVFSCAFCGRPIFPGDQVPLFEKPPEFILPDGAKIYNGMLIGCYTDNCASKVADLGFNAAGTGFAKPNGGVFRMNIWQINDPSQKNIKSAN